jgi:hypothetical protein
VLGEREGVSIYLSIVLACSAVWKRGQLKKGNIISSKHLYYGLIAAARRAAEYSSRDVLYCDW